MKLKITLQAEAWKFITGAKSAPLTSREIELVAGIAGIVVDHSNNVFNAARKKWAPQPFLPDEPNSELEHWLLIFKRHPDAVLHVMGAMTAYLRKRKAQTAELAKRTLSTKRKTLREISAALQIDEDTLKRARTRLNSLAKLHAEMTEHPLKKFERQVAEHNSGGTKSARRRPSQ